MNTKNILITGASGMLGTALSNKLQSSPHKIHKTTFPDSNPHTTVLDITDPRAVSEIFQTAKPDIVFNCAAYTDVDTAQKDTKTAMAVNASAPQILAENCKNHNALLVHISTDYVFNGTAVEPYKPDDKPAPNTIYGKSKLHGEKAIIETDCKSIIIRTSWLFGPHGKNFVTTIINLAKTRDQIKVVNDQTGCPTYTLDLADAMIALAEKHASGIFHFCNPPACTWYDFACQIIKTANLDCKVNPCTTADFPRPAPRPQYSVMDISQTEKLIPEIIRPWQQALTYYIQATGI